MKEPIESLGISKGKLEAVIAVNSGFACLQGKFSELDSTSWTPELQRALNYDRKSALQIDNGKILLACAY